VLSLPEIVASPTAAAYLSFGTEPATHELVAVLAGRGVQVLVPAVTADLDLDWVRYDGRSTDLGARATPVEPAGPRLGLSAIGTADVVIVPALAVDERGMRLGRGGGSYDRALSRVGTRTSIVALLYDGEVLPDVPAEAHDRAVTIAVTPSRVWRFTPAARSLRQ